MKYKKYNKVFLILKYLLINWLRNRQIKRSKFVTNRDTPFQLIILHRYLESIKYKYNFKYNSNLLMHFDYFLEYIEGLFQEWYKPKKIYTDEYIQEHLFTKEVQHKDIVNHCKINHFALIKTCKRIYFQLKDFNNLDKNTHLDLIKLLKEISFESIMFIEESFFYVKGYDLQFGYIKRQIANSHDILSGIENMLRSRLFENGSFSILTRPTAIFLIRQYIEIRLKNAFGISSITKTNNEMVRFPPEKFFTIIQKNRQLIELPLKLSIIKKIHNWSQYYIHAGMIPDIWVIEWAYYTINNLGKAGELDGRWSIYGGIRIDESLYNNIGEIICDMLNDRTLNVHRMSTPESLIKKSTN